MKFEEALEKYLPGKGYPQFKARLEYNKGRFEFGLKVAKALNDKIGLKGKKILDIGLGTGGVAAAISKYGANLYGIDSRDYCITLSKIMSKEKKANIKIKKWNGKNIPFPSNYFDMVIAIDTIDHFRDPYEIVKEVARVLKINGKCYFTAERRISPFFIIKDPHSGLPFIILLPRKLREWLIVKVFRRD
jgi:ubiquinone/menaquinone biosynthesis C-methylase UbiE